MAKPGCGLRAGANRCRSMTVYGDFARCYTKGPWAEFSQGVAAELPGVLDLFGEHPHAILDLACGEGTFAVAMASRGYQVTGVDSSTQMLEFARDRAAKENANVEFLLRDMRSLDFVERFNLVTCWFDSLNYLLELSHLEEAFTGVYRALRRGGLFVFDMNTIYGLAVGWQRQPYYVQTDTDEMFEVGFPSYDREHKVATLMVRGFVKDGDRWYRVSEEHRERGYNLKEIRLCLKRTGLRELACWDDLEERNKVTGASERVWFVTRKVDVI
ncbi:class I SAM-dependent DNA methyltransferase [Chloroflexota bacterium]